MACGRGAGVWCVAGALATTQGSGIERAPPKVLRALLREGDEGIERGRAVLARVELIKVNERVLNAAGLLQPHDVRSLDAIHLATAHALGSDLGHVISYDERMVEAAKRLGLKTASPA